MSIELQQTKRRIHSTRQIQQVTSAMQRVASARLMNDRKRIGTSRRYTARLIQLLSDLAPEAGDIEHPLLKSRESGDIGLLVLGSDRGLCGGYHSAVMEQVASFVAEQDPRELQVFAVGRIIERRSRRLGLTVSRYFPQPSRAQREQVLDELSEFLQARFLDGTLREIHVLYTEFVSGLKQVPTRRRLLPATLDPMTGASDGTPQPVADHGLATAIFEPGAGDLVKRLLPEYVRQVLDYMFLSSVTSENAARQAAMSRASENAKGILGELMQSYRRLRQESITAEILEVAAGGGMTAA